MSDVLDVFSVAVYVRRLGDLKMLSEDLLQDLSFVKTLRRFMLPLPFVDAEASLNSYVFEQ